MEESDEDIAWAPSDVEEPEEPLPDDPLAMAIETLERMNNALLEANRMLEDELRRERAEQRQLRRELDRLERENERLERENERLRADAEVDAI